MVWLDNIHFILFNSSRSLSPLHFDHIRRKILKVSTISDGIFAVCISVCKWMWIRFDSWTVNWMGYWNRYRIQLSNDNFCWVYFFSSSSSSFNRFVFFFFCRCWLRMVGDMVLQLWCVGLRKMYVLAMQMVSSVCFASLNLFQKQKSLSLSPLHLPNFKICIHTKEKETRTKNALWSSNWCAPCFFFFSIFRSFHFIWSSAVSFGSLFYFKYSSYI